MLLLHNITAGDMGSVWSNAICAHSNQLGRKCSETALCQNLVLQACNPQLLGRPRQESHKGSLSGLQCEFKACLYNRDCQKCKGKKTWLVRQHSGREYFWQMQGPLFNPQYNNKITFKRKNNCRGEALAVVRNLPTGSLTPLPKQADTGQKASNSQR